MEPPPRPRKDSDVDEDSTPWLHGAVSRDDAEALLKGKNRGTFLVRTKTGKCDMYVLTLKLQKGEGCEHHMITTKRGVVKVNKDKVPCTTLAQTIAFLRANPEQLTVPLRTGVSA